MVYSAIYINSYWNRYPKMHNARVSTNNVIKPINNKDNLEPIFICTDFGL